MTRFLLAVSAILVALLAYDRIDRARRAPAPPPPTVVVQQSPAPARQATSNARTVVPSGGTPALDLLARLEGRRRLQRAAGTTYFDSLFAETDSLVRRWPDQQGLIFVVAIPPGDSADRDAPLRPVIEGALSAWESAGIGVRFTVRLDTAGANIVALSTASLGGDRAGQTDIRWTPDGAIHSATITISRRDQDGRVIAGPLLHAVAVHEIGHALGLAHSPRPDDVMFPTTRAGTPSSRDRATVTLLYQLPLGSVRETIP